mmetsp:Transcript_1502/g.2646  ORF Transcript_1502/g.2646 Transcript_1502/m.2646 type:complete len:272 (-) Transcript_1502:69-884(-)
MQRLQDSKLAPNNSLSVLQGTLILWLAWLMFNGGSSLAITGSSGDSAQLAIVNTILAPCVGGLFTFFFKKHMAGGDIKNQRFDFMGLCNGVLAGLVAITASCDCVEPWAAIIIGVFGSITYSLAVRFCNYIELDDPIEAFQVHGCCGFIGCILLAFFKIDDGILYGGEGSGKLLLVQLYGCAAIAAWSMSLTTVFFLIGNKLNAVRMDDSDEILGGDIHYFAPIEFEGKAVDYELEMADMSLVHKPVNEKSNVFTETKGEKMPIDFHASST